MEKWSKPFAPALYQTLVHSFAFLLAATRQRQKAKGKGKGKDKDKGKVMGEKATYLPAEKERERQRNF